MRAPVIEEGPYTLRLPRAEDVSWVFHACQDEAIQRFTDVPTPYRPSDAVDWVHRAAEWCRMGSQLHFVVARTETGELLGAASLKLDGADGRGELGYWVERYVRREGVARSAIQALEIHARDVLLLSEIVLRIAEGNAASRALALSCGYRLTGQHAEPCKGDVALIYTKSLACD